MRYYTLLLLSIIALNATAQHEEWRTGIRDTTYNTMQDYQHNLKKFPFIKIVPDSNSSKVREKRNLVYCQVGGRQLHLDAFSPAKKLKKAMTAVLIIHGGGWRSGNRSQHIPLAQHLAGMGYTCFTLEYRLSTEAFYPAAVNDIKSALKWMRANAKEFNIDPTKFAIMGFSAGGQLAALTGVTSGLTRFDKNDCNNEQSSAVQAVIDIDGTLSFVHPESSETQNQQNVGASAWWIGYPRTERLDLWEDASPLSYANRNTVPFLFLNSAVERMHAGRDDFKKAMDEKGVYTKVVTYENTPHSFCLYRPWFDPMVKDIDIFLSKIFK